MSRIKIEGISETVVAIKRVGDRVFKSELAFVRKMGEAIKERAIEYAPVDEGDLESAITTEESVDAGAGHRKIIYVGVDPELLGPGYQRYGFRYDISTHELMDTPYGEGVIRRGPLTQAKSDDAGGKYLERAFQDYHEELLAGVKRIMNQEGRL